VSHDTPTRKVYYLDLLERVLWTFVQGFAAAWLVLGDFSRESFMVGLAAGCVALAKGVVAKTFGDHSSAATLPSPPDSTVPGQEDVA
jgi:hypothetical protein